MRWRENLYEQWEALHAKCIFYKYTYVAFNENPDITEMYAEIREVQIDLDVFFNLVLFSEHPLETWNVCVRCSACLATEQIMPSSSS